MDFIGFSVCTKIFNLNFLSKMNLTYLCCNLYDKVVPCQNSSIYPFTLVENKSSYCNIRLNNHRVCRKVDRLVVCSVDVQGFRSVEPLSFLSHFIKCPP